MSEELRKVDRVMLETLQDICGWFARGDLKVRNRASWEENRKRVAALLTEQPEQDERWCTRCGHSKEYHQALGCMACAARCRCKTFVEPDAPQECNGYDCCPLQPRLNKAEQQRDQYKEKLDTLQAQYSDLLMQVVNKIPGESRHETAKRIIRQHEIPKDSPAQEVGGSE